LAYKSEKKVVFIWPPYVIDSKDASYPGFFPPYFFLPIGIARLSAFLKNKGYSNISFADLNHEYCKTMKVFWFLRQVSLSSHRFLTFLNRYIKKKGHINVDKKGKKKKFSLFYVFVRGINRYLADIVAKKLNLLPTYEDVIHTDLDSYNTKEFRRVQRLIQKHVVLTADTTVCISCLHAHQLYFAVLIARYIKTVNNTITIVLGGAHITYNIAEITGVDRMIQYFDFIVFGDGEKPLEMILNLSKGIDKANIPNLYFNNGTRFEISQSVYSLNPEEFDTPDFSLFMLNNYDNRVPFIISKGCWWGKCAFCTHSKHVKKFGFSICSVDKTIQNIKKLQMGYSISKIRFVDDALPSSYLRALADKLFKENIAIKWSCNIIINLDFVDDSFCSLLKKAGLQSVAIGLESISPRITAKMNKYHKQLSRNEIKSIIDALHRAHIGTRLNIMYGFPTETKSEARDTLDFLIKNQYYNISISAFALEKDTEIFDSPERFGIKEVYKGKKIGDRYGYSYYHGNSISDAMSQDKIWDFTQYAYRMLQKEKDMNEMHK